MEITNVVLLGETGHGRSSIVNSLRNPTSPMASVGKSAGGVTKEITAYPMQELPTTQIVDTPGFGSHGVSLPKLIADIEALLTGAKHGEVRGIAVTCPVDSPRLMLGTHVVQALVMHGLQGSDAWNHVMLVGTKSDRSSEEDRQFFVDHLTPAFFNSAPPGSSSKRLHALVHKDDCSALAAAITELPNKPLVYKPPDAKILAGHLAELLGEDIEAFSEALRRARAGEPHELPLHILVIGECGDGKSTLINALRNASEAAAQPSGKHPRGITKEITCIAGSPIEGRSVNYLDSPGIGDMDVSTMDLVLMLEHIFHPEVSGGIDGLIVTCPATNARIRLGGRIVQLLVDLGFRGARKWSNVILVGTKADRADAKERANFKMQICQDFFGKAIQGGEPLGRAVLCAPGNYEDLKQAIVSLPKGKVVYQPPPSKQLSEALGVLLGVDAQLLETNAEASRALMEEVKQQHAELERSASALAQKEREYRQAKALMEREKERLTREAQKHAAELANYQAQWQAHQQHQNYAAQGQHVQDSRYWQQRLLDHQLEQDQMLAAKAQLVEEERSRHMQQRQMVQEANRQRLEQIQEERQGRQGVSAMMTHYACRMADSLSSLIPRLW